MMKDMSPGWLAGLRSPDRPGRAEYRDMKVRGLCLRVSWTGAREWSVVCVDGTGRRRRRPIGSYPAWSLPDARIRAAEILADAARGALDPGEPPALIRDLVADYVAQHVAAELRPKTAADVRRRLERTVLVAWPEREVAAIRRIDVRRLLDEVAERGPIEANRTLALLGHMFGWAVRRGRYGIEANPARDQDRPGKERARERVLTDAEIRAVWAACEASGAAGKVLQIMLVTGQRGQEVKGLAPEEIAAGVWTIPASRMKGGREHRVPLSSLAARIVEDIGAGVGINSRQMRSLRDRAGVRERWTPHDLRRTAATNMERLGVERWVIGQVLAHAAPADAREAKVTAVYARPRPDRYDAEKRDALERWAARLEEILGRPGP